MNANKFIARLNVNKAKASKNSPTSRIPNATTTLRHDEFWKFGEQEFSKNFRPPSTKERTVSSCPFRILLVRCIIVYENFVLCRSVLYRAPSSYDVSPFLYSNTRKTWRGSNDISRWNVAWLNSRFDRALFQQCIATSHLYSPARYLRDVISWMVDLLSRVSPFIFEIENSYSVTIVKLETMWN